MAAGRRIADSVRDKVPDGAQDFILVPLQAERLSALRDLVAAARNRTAFLGGLADHHRDIHGFRRAVRAAFLKFREREKIIHEAAHPVSLLFHQRQMLAPDPDRARIL